MREEGDKRRAGLEKQGREKQGIREAEDERSRGREKQEMKEAGDERSRG